nr:IS30 family transposase [Xanthomonas oryzae]
MPWKRLLALIEPHYPVSGRPGRQPYALATMLRIHLLQQWYALSDPAMEEALHEIPTLRRFAQLGGLDNVPDETTILNFRRLLETHGIAARMLEAVNAYTAIYAHPRGGLKKELVEALRQHKPTRCLRRTTAAKRTWVPEELRIVHRPEEVAQCLIPGHWEGDLIKGAFNRSCVGTLVERKTRFVVLCKMDGCTAENALEGFTRQMKKLPHCLLGSLTYDRGTEMTCYPELMKRLNIDLWFADPHAPWQRGSNENTNGLLCQFMRKRWEHFKASVRAKVEHPFRVIKRQFGYTKVRYRGLGKNTAQVQTLFALSNLWMVRRHLLPARG